MLCDSVGSFIEIINPLNPDRICKLEEEEELNKQDTKPSLYFDDFCAFSVVVRAYCACDYL